MLILAAVLDVSNNNLRGLSKVLDDIGHLRFLRHLELLGNPVCEARADDDWQSHPAPLWLLFD